MNEDRRLAVIGLGITAMGIPATLLSLDLYRLQ